MRSLRLAIAGCALAMGVGVIAAPTAAADDPYGFYQYRDRTSYFVSVLDPGAALNPANSHKPLLYSPFGTTRRIECRGDGHYVAIHACRQYDMWAVPHEVRFVAQVFRQLWVYIP